MSDKKYVGAIAAAKIVALIKAALGKKLDKSGGTVTGNLEINGDVHAGGAVQSDLLLSAPSVAVHNGAGALVGINCSGDNAAGISSLGSDGKSRYSRFAVGTPTGDNDAATKAYVDAKVDTTVYVDFWPTDSGVEYVETFKAYGVALASSQTFDSVFDLMKSGNKVIARFYDSSDKTNLVAESLEARLSGDKELDNINFLFINAATDAPLGFATIADAIWITKINNNTAAYVFYRYCALPIPAGDGSDNGKVPAINGTKWELKEPSSGDFVITATLASGGAATLDKTFAQIRDAITGGKAVFMQIVDPKGGSTIHASLVGDAPTSLIFSAVARNGFYSVLNVVTVNSDDSCTVSHETMPVLDSKLALPQLSMASTPDEDMEIATKKYVDDHPAKDAVLYTAQELTFKQKQQARKNIEAADSVAPTITGLVSMCPDHITDSNVAVHIVPSKVDYSDYTITLDCGPENWPVRVAGIRTPTDAQTDHAANVAYVKAKIAEVAASGGVDVDNALSATSTNPVQNKVITAALAGKAGTAAATTSANGLMSKADKTKLNGIAAGATKITIDSAMSGSSNNPVANHVVKQYVDDKVAAAGSNITVDAALSSTSANPVQNKAVKAAIDAKADKTALDAKADKTALNAKLDKTGGTLTGNLTGKYITGTWLQSTAASDLGRTPGKIAVLDDSGWVYYRTPSELFADLGITNAIKSYVDAAIIAAINSAY